MRIDRNDELSLHRPIVFLDIQTTGPDRRTARESSGLATLRIERGRFPKFTNLISSIRCRLFRRAPPTFHGLADEDVADAEPFAAYAASLARHLEGCDLAGFGIRRFHLVVLRREFEYSRDRIQTWTTTR